MKTQHLDASNSYENSEWPVTWSVSCRLDSELKSSDPKIRAQKRSVMGSILTVSSKKQVAKSTAKGCANGRTAKCQQNLVMRLLLTLERIMSME